MLNQVEERNSSEGTDELDFQTARNKSSIIDGPPDQGFEFPEEMKVDRVGTQVIKAKQPPSQREHLLIPKQADEFETGSISSFKVASAQNKNLNSMHFDDMSSYGGTVMGKEDSNGRRTQIIDDMTSQGSYMVKVTGNEDRQFDDGSSQGSSQMVRVAAAGGKFDDMSSQGSYMVRGGGGGRFDDMSSQGSYMVKVGRDGQQMVDDMSSQGSYMVRAPGGQHFDDDLSSQGSYLVRSAQHGHAAGHGLDDHSNGSYMIRPIQEEEKHEEEEDNRSGRNLLRKAQ